MNENELTERVISLLEERKLGEIRAMLAEMNSADIAAMLEEVPESSLPILFRLLPKKLAAETFVDMESEEQELLISSFSDSELKEVIDRMFLDDTVDVIEEMPANVVKRIIKHSTPEMRKMINEILNYPKDCAGSIMTIEYISLRGNMTVQEAFARIRATGVNKETIYTCYVTGADRSLLGLVTVKDLLLADGSALIEDIMETNLISVGTLEDKEIVAQKFDKYGFLAMPVVDNENRLVGIVTVDDAMEVIQEEATEDIEMMAAITPTDKPYMKTGAFETWKKRIPWLLLLMISATFTGKIIQHYEAALGAYVVLTMFIPMLMDTGGNAGGQASVTIIRGLSLREIEYKDVLRVLGKEVFVAILCGITLAAANFLKMMFVDRVEFSVAVVVCMTLMLTIIIAKAVGCSLPILAKRIGFDPAVMASPFITTIVDAISLMVYFNIATHVLAF